MSWQTPPEHTEATGSPSDQGDNEGQATNKLSESSHTGSLTAEGETQPALFSAEVLKRAQGYYGLVKDPEKLFGSLQAELMVLPREVLDWFVQNKVNFKALGDDFKGHLANSTAVGAYWGDSQMQMEPLYKWWHSTSFIRAMTMLTQEPTEVMPDALRREI